MNNFIRVGPVRCSLESGIGRIVLQSPEKANALGPESVNALASAIDNLLSKAPKVVVLSAEGPVFCAGGDIGALQAALPDVNVLLDELVGLLHPSIQRLAESPVPVICALSGTVSGAGIGLALCADFVLASASMKMRTGYCAIGLSPDAGTSYFLSRRVGPQKAKQWLMLSDPIDANHCLEAGAVDAVHSPEDLPVAVESLARKLASGSRGSLDAVKKLCSSHRNLGEQLAMERELLLDRSRGLDAYEGLRAFLERRPPSFTS